jgi:hypothetical protein
MIFRLVLEQLSCFSGKWKNYCEIFVTASVEKTALFRLPQIGLLCA